MRVFTNQYGDLVQTGSPGFSWTYKVEQKSAIFPPVLRKAFTAFEDTFLPNNWLLG